MRVVVAFMGVVVVFFFRMSSPDPSLVFDSMALKCLAFSGLARRRLAGRIFRLVFLCCFVQVISLSTAAGGRRGKIKVFDAHTPNNQFKRRCDRGQMGEFCGYARQSLNGGLQAKS